MKIENNNQMQMSESVGFINLGSLMDRLPSKSLTQQTTSRTNVQPLGRPKNLTTGQNGARSPPTPAHLSDRKAWPRRNDACFRLQPASLTGDTSKPLLTALLRLVQSEPTGTNRPGTLAR